MTYTYDCESNSNAKIGFDLLDIFAFGLGLFSKLSFRLLGVVYISELVCIAILPFAIFSINLTHRLRKLLIFLGIWVSGSYISNIYNDVSLTDNIKGVVSKLMLFAIIPVLIWVLENKPMRIMYFAAGQAISALLSVYVFQSTIVSEFEIAETDEIIYYWFPLIAVTAGILYYLTLKKIGMLILISGGVFSLYWSSRNLFLSSVIAIMLTIVFSVFYTPYSDRKNNKVIVIILALLAIAVGLFVSKSAYSDMANSGELGEAAYQKYTVQNNEKMGLMSGRSDFFMAMVAIYKNPIWGYGDYAKDKENIRQDFVKKYMNHSYYSSRKSEKKPMPGHSHILGAWVYNGILSLPFWGYSFYLVCLFMIKCLYKTGRLLLFSSFLLASTIFNFLFSPFNDRFEMIILVFFMTMVSINEQLKDKKSESKQPQEIL